MDTTGQPGFPQVHQASSEPEPYRPHFRAPEPLPHRRGRRLVRLVVLLPPLLALLVVWISLPPHSRPTVTPLVPQSLFHWNRHESIQPKTNLPIRIGFVPHRARHLAHKTHLPSPLTTPVPTNLLISSGWSSIPGALPPHFRYQYNDSYRGWPVQPLHHLQIVRGSFLAPRSLNSAYHFGVDISVNDAHPDPAAPKGASQRVYAVESGVVSKAQDGVFNQGGCTNQRLAVGHFEYWHVMSILPLGTYVRPGEQIGWSCRGEYHVHLSEWQRLNGHLIWVNPLHKGGKLAPYRDKAPPRVESLAFYGPTPRKWCPKKDLRSADGAIRLNPSYLRGDVELRAHINDFRTISGFLSKYPRTRGGLTPYQVAVAVRNSSGNIVFSQISLRAAQIPHTPYLIGYAPGTAQPLPMSSCLASKAYCGGSFIYRPFSRFIQTYWNTASSSTPNGTYTVTVYAWDIKGNVGEKSQTVVVDNAAPNTGPVLVPSSTQACWQTTEHRQYLAQHTSD